MYGKPVSPVPPLFGDLGKSARDLFDKNFDFGKVKLQLKTKTESDSDNGVEFETNGTYDVERSRTCGSLKTKMKFPKYNVTFQESWNTNSEIDTELSHEPKSIEGLKLTLNSCFLPSSGVKSAKAKTSYKTNYVSAEAEVDILMTGPTFKGSTVLQYKGWYAGYQIGYNTSSAKLMANNLAVGYTAPDFNVHARLTDVCDCVTSVYHMVNNKVEVGINTTYNLQTSHVGLGAVGKIMLDDSSVVKAKVNNQGQVGLAYTHNLSRAVKLNLSGLLEGKNINAGGHKLGISMTYEGIPMAS